MKSKNAPTKGLDSQRFTPKEDDDAPVETVAHKESGTEGAWDKEDLGHPGGLVVSILGILRSGQDFTCIGSDMFVCSWCFHILSVVPILEGDGVTTLLFGCFVDGKFFELAVCFCFHVVNKRIFVFETYTRVNLQSGK